MSKKVFIIILAVVLFVGTVATVVTAVIFSPFNSAKRSLKSAETAREIKVTLTQSYYSEVVNKKTVLYKKTEEGYSVTEKVQSFSKDPFGETVYNENEKTYVLQTFTLPFFNFRSRYLSDKKTENSTATIFTANVKENRVTDFFGSSTANGYKDVYVTIGYSDKTVYVYSVNYKINSDDFSITTEFFY